MATLIHNYAAASQSNSMQISDILEATTSSITGAKKPSNIDSTATVVANSKATSIASSKVPSIIGLEATSNAGSETPGITDPKTTGSIGSKSPAITDLSISSVAESIASFVETEESERFGADIKPIIRPLNMLSLIATNYAVSGVVLSIIDVLGLQDTSRWVRCNDGDDEALTAALAPLVDLAKVLVEASRSMEYTDETALVSFAYLKEAVKSHYPKSKGYPHPITSIIAY